MAGIFMVSPTAVIMAVIMAAVTVPIITNSTMIAVPIIMTNTAAIVMVILAAIVISVSPISPTAVIPVVTITIHVSILARNSVAPILLLLLLLLLLIPIPTRLPPASILPTTHPPFILPLPLPVQGSGSFLPCTALVLVLVLVLVLAISMNTAGQALTPHLTVPATKRSKHPDHKLLDILRGCFLGEEFCRELAPGGRRATSERGGVEDEGDLGLVCECYCH